MTLLILLNEDNSSIREMRLLSSIAHNRRFMVTAHHPWLTNGLRIRHVNNLPTSIARLLTRSVRHTPDVR